MISATILPTGDSESELEVNGEIVQRNKYANLILNKNDKVEIVQFIGGG